jgi:histidinol dehydrogenase
MIMQKINYPSRENWAKLCARPKMEPARLDILIDSIFEQVALNGDVAIRSFTSEFDKVILANLEVSSSEIKEAIELIPEELKKAIQLAASNIRKFHKTQNESLQFIETTPGVTCWRESRAIDSVGLYIPAGSAPLFSTVLMLGIPAVLAGCTNIVLCSPADSKGKIDPAILFTADLIGINKIFKIGGAQAIAGMALGTESIPKVNKLFGPGNQYVTAAKVFAQKMGVAIDLPAGPSEVLVISDSSGEPQYIAADLLAQAEHGPDSQVILVSDSENIIQEVQAEISKQVKDLPRRNIAINAMENSRLILLNSIQECLDFSNQYAPEHLILQVDTVEDILPSIQNAGSVFIGKYSCESAGDYASGTNHTLPTLGYANAYSGVSLDSFIKKITFQKISKEGIQNLGPSIEIMAEAEGLLGHKNAVSVRLNTILNEQIAKTENNEQLK